MMLVHRTISQNAAAGLAHTYKKKKVFGDHFAFIMDLFTSLMIQRVKDDDESRSPRCSRRISITRHHEMRTSPYESCHFRMSWAKQPEGFVLLFRMPSSSRLSLVILAPSGRGPKSKSWRSLIVDWVKKERKKKPPFGCVYALYLPDDCAVNHQRSCSASKVVIVTRGAFHRARVPHRPHFHIHVP